MAVVMAAMMAMGLVGDTPIEKQKVTMVTERKRRLEAMRVKLNALRRLRAETAEKTRRRQERIRMREEEMEMERKGVVRAITMITAEEMWNSTNMFLKEQLVGWFRLLGK